MTIHDFHKSLEMSHSHATASWWLPCYRMAFPTLSSCVDVREDGWAQRGGIDRVITLQCGRVISVDEKVRDKDYGDILLEIWSDKQKKVLGWAAKSLACDFIAYAVVPANKCYLLPTLMLQKTLRDNAKEWWELAKKSESGFRVCEANNKSYVTVSIAVPLDTFFASMTHSMIVPWGPA